MTERKKIYIEPDRVGDESAQVVYAAIIRHEDGTETVPGMHTAMGVLPMMTTSASHVEFIIKHAESIAKDTGKKVALYKYTQREQIAFYDPTYVEKPE